MWMFPWLKAEEKKNYYSTSDAYYSKGEMTFCDEK